ncbi:NADH-quinone oxidoreductase subunit H [Bailinhaonella thermotolerans]|uniref:NADH-quinone oxidoreductase subunit H n=1 Tax=Bailinhaonella thermotolerans TaxID=1070861 RepID=A0A3A4ADN3_9ACTN|nr:NADH-quinone oxidoreductase subunit H [Bailinhaonella thermotolerans]
MLALAYGAAALRAVLSPEGAGAARPWREAARPLREVARLLTQRRRRTPLPDTTLMRAGIVTLPVVAALAGVVVPLGGEPVADLGVGVVWFNAMEVCGWAALWLTGWGANSVYPLVGGYRFLAQGIAYELPHMFALMAPALGAGSLRVGEIVAAQERVWFAVTMPVAFAVYLVSALAMAFWGPLGQPLGADVAGGVPAELSGPDRLVFLAGRYLLLTVAAAMAVPLFLGGGAGPLLPAWAWSPVKTAAVLALLVWARGRLPVVRVDRFLAFGWLALIPLALLQLLGVSVMVVAGG